MKRYRHKAALLAVACVWSGGFSLEAQPMRGEMDRGQMDRGEMMERMQGQMAEMRERMSEMQGRMQRMDKELEQQLQEMTRSEGDAKIQAMEETIRTLAEQRMAMNAHRNEMMERMMNHMEENGMMNRGGMMDRDEYGDRPDRMSNPDQSSEPTVEKRDRDEHPGATQKPAPQ